ncbi:MAG: SGNH/GDSL hydrolase family protein [Armatimonadetes bacterium]|nr:SGNH/GDSL hydrolase family protein [Armatimonadota bacterium]
MKWLPVLTDPIAVSGLPFWREDGILRRLPLRMKEAVPPGVWGLAQHTSGARLRFASDTTDLALRARFDGLGYMNNMPRSGQVGLDLWIDGEYWRPLFPSTNAIDFCEPFFGYMPRQRREVCLYLGLYAPIEIIALGVDDEATLEPPAPFALDQPVVYYGSSITQGGCAARAGMSYQAIVSRALNVDFVNLGFSGAGRGEPALADAVGEIEACCYVMDWAQNCPTLEEFASRYDPFLETIRQSRPETPIICITPIWSQTELVQHNERFGQMREVIRQVVGERQDAGDAHLTLVEGFDLLGPDDRDGLVDLSHPNDIGFTSMARGLEPVLRRVLGLEAGAP